MTPPITVSEDDEANTAQAAASTSIVMSSTPEPLQDLNMDDAEARTRTFFSLPFELRQPIYTEYFRLADASAPSPHYTALLSTCKQIHAEASPAFFANFQDNAYMMYVTMNQPAASNGPKPAAMPVRLQFYNRSHLALSWGFYGDMAGRVTNSQHVHRMMHFIKHLLIEIVDEPDDAHDVSFPSCDALLSNMPALTNLLVIKSPDTHDSAGFNADSRLKEFMQAASSLRANCHVRSWHMSMFEYGDYLEEENLVMDARSMGWDFTRFGDLVMFERSGDAGEFARDAFLAVFEYTDVWKISYRLGDIL